MTTYGISSLFHITNKHISPLDINGTLTSPKGPEFFTHENAGNYGLPRQRLGVNLSDN